MTELENRILAFLEASPNSTYNFSEIGRALGKAPPTIKRAIDKLYDKNKVMVADKKSMKLVKLCK